MKITICYGSHAGQTEKVAKFIAGHLAAKGLEVKVVEISGKMRKMSLADSEAVIIGAPVRAGKPFGRMVTFARSNAAVLSGKPTAVFLVCLTAKGRTEKDLNEVKRYLNGFAESSGIRPSLSAAFAGSLPFTRYNPAIRFLMKKISQAQGGDFDTSRDYEYTDWKQVEQFADSFAQTLRQSAAS